MSACVVNVFFTLISPKEIICKRSSIHYGMIRCYDYETHYRLNN